MPSFILIRQTVWPQYTNVIDRETDRQTDRTDRQRSDSIGRTVLQTVAQKKKKKEKPQLQNIMACPIGRPIHKKPMPIWTLLMHKYWYKCWLAKKHPQYHFHYFHVKVLATLILIVQKHCQYIIAIAIDTEVTQPGTQKSESTYGL